MQINRAQGFTLVEVLVVAPIIILFIGGFIGLILNLTGNTLKANQQNTLAYEGQDALRAIEESAESATAYLTSTTPSPLPSPLGKDGGTAPFTNTTVGQPDSLIFNSPATTTSPFSAAKRVIYTGAGACNNANPIFTYTSVYFISANTLYKRTIVPTTASCEAPWQRSSCYAANVSTGNCLVEDEKIIDNVETMDITYYSGTTLLGDSSAASANSISISLTLSKKVSGKSVKFTSSSRITGSNI